MQFVKTLLSFCNRSDKKYSIFLLIMLLFTAVIELVGIGSLFPYIKILADKAFIHKNYILNEIYHFFNFRSDNNFLIFIGLGIFTMLLLKAIMSTLNNFFQAKLTYQINNRISKRCLSSYIDMPYEKVIEKNSAVLSKHLLLDVTSIANTIQATLTLMTDSIVAIALITLMIAVDPMLVLTVVFGLGLMLLFVNAFLRSRISRLSVKNEICNRHTYQTASEALTSLKDIKAYNIKNYFLDRYMKWQHQISTQMIEFSVLSNVPTNIMNVMGFGVLLIVLLVLLFTHGNLISILPTIGIIAVSVQRLLPSAGRISTSIANIRRFKPVVFIVRDAMSHFFQFEDSHSISQTSPKKLSYNSTIELKNICYRYPSKTTFTLKNINFKINKNSSYGIVGESGSGKSTLVDVLLGLLPLTSGKIYCDNKELSNNEIRSFSSIVGYVPQQVSLLDATIRDNILFGVPEKDVNEDALKTAISIAQLNNLISRLPDGINTKIGDKGTKLSGGQRQRIGIARALYRNPDILIMDEATNALDAATEKEFNSALLSLMRDKTLIIITHRLSSVAICKNIIQLENGEIIAQGSYEDLLKASESFRRIYNINDEKVF